MAVNAAVVAVLRRVDKVCSGLCRSSERLSCSEALAFPSVSINETMAANENS